MEEQDDETAFLVSEFEKWNQESQIHNIYLLEASSEKDESIKMLFSLAGEYEFALRCPSGYPDCCDGFLVEMASPSLQQWSSALNEFILDTTVSLKLNQILSKAVLLYANKCESRTQIVCSSEEESMDDDEPDAILSISDDEAAFTTEWELNLTRQKKRWAQKELEIRRDMSKVVSSSSSSSTDFNQTEVPVEDRKQAKQIFSNTASSGILTNDLVAIIQNEKAIGISAEAIDDNIYNWSVKINNFKCGSDLDNDLKLIQQKFNYNYIELQLKFIVDMYPFYPPQMKVIRPRLEAAMMQRVPNMELLKLSYWNPARNMQSILAAVKEFLQQWARLEVDSPRNDPICYPQGSYLEVEHHLLRLAMLAEVNPRANYRYASPVVEKAVSVKTAPSKTEKMSKTKKKAYWAAGTGYGHTGMAGWDVEAYQAAQKLKDKEVESVLQTIVAELKARHISSSPSSIEQLHVDNCRKNDGKINPKRSKSSTVGSSKRLSSDRKVVVIDTCCGEENQLPGPSTSNSVPLLRNPTYSGDARNSEQHDCDKLGADHSMEVSECNRVPSPTSLNIVPDPEDDWYSVLEGSALIPFLETHLSADSMVEVYRHTNLYGAIVEVIKEIAYQPQLVPLLGPLVYQSRPISLLLLQLAEKATMLLQTLGKAVANGSIPQMNHESKLDPNSKTKAECITLQAAEEKLTREFSTLYHQVSTSLEHEGQSSGNIAMESMKMEIDLSVQDSEELRYREPMKSQLFQNTNFVINGFGNHHYATAFKKAPLPSKLQIFRIAQELTSFSGCLPLNLSSSIFVRADEDKLTLLRALITGPEGTPYSGGCYQFDIFFPEKYPQVPPLVSLKTTGNGTVRFNPNLYACGKVCLSLLGTWEGTKGEQWSSETSTLLQVLVSIQSLIMVPDPYFNEPGYEIEINTENGRRKSATYNEEVKANNIRWAMLEQLNRPSPGFEDVIKLHFVLKKDKILQEVKTWLPGHSTKLQQNVEALEKELNKLKLPAHLQKLIPDKTR